MAERNFSLLNDVATNRQETILVVDDDATLRMVITEALNTCSYEIHNAENVSVAKNLILENYYDLIITDIVMPGESGVDLLGWAKENGIKSSFIIMTLLEAVGKILENERLRRQNEELRTKLASYNEQLEKEIEEAKLENQRLFMATLTSLTNAIDARDQYTCAHSSSVAELAEALAHKMGMSSSFQATIKTAGQLHDIGKIAVPEHILLKPAKLTAEEFDLIKEHPVQGERILTPIPDFDTILPAIRNHHERFEGGGYPDNLIGDEIPLIARIISVCDTWDAMRTTRPYRAIMPYEKALSIIIDERNKQFDPDIADTFIEMIESSDVHAYH